MNTPAAYYRFSGLNPRGIVVTGNTTDAPEDFVKSCFERGWKTLRLIAECRDELVGEIAPHPDSGFRVWWSS